MERILLVDDEASILSVLSTLLKAEGYEVVATRDGNKAIELARDEHFELMIADIRMSPVDGIKVLRTVRNERPAMCVIMLTAYGSVETAIEALKLGAFDYITKPFKVDEILIAIQRGLEYTRALSENMDLKAQLGARYEFDNIVAESPAMQEVCEMIKRVAPSDTTVLVYGESGTGKELVAQAIHVHSRRKNKKFLAVNCAALPELLLESEMFGHVKGAFTGASSDKEGLFEAADGGTLFLDEISSMSLGIQSKLLRMLQEKEVRRVGSNTTIEIDARVIAATNVRLEEKIEDQTFREDLYYRLSVIPIEIKPLRERPEDTMPLVRHFIRQGLPEGAELTTIEPDVRSLLEQYAWPGNVRELDNAVKHAMTFARNNTITLDDLPPKILKRGGEAAMAAGVTATPEGFQGVPLKEFMRDKERDYLKSVIKHMNGDKDKAARAMQISLATLYRKLPRLEKD